MIYTLLIAGALFHYMKGDLGVLFIEAMEGLTYRNDGQVARLIVEKVYAPSRKRPSPSSP